jgi:hypothetical protein
MEGIQRMNFGDFQTVEFERGCVQRTDFERGRKTDEDERGLAAD